MLTRTLTVEIYDGDDILTIQSKEVPFNADVEIAAHEMVVGWCSANGVVYDEIDWATIEGDFDENDYEVTLSFETSAPNMREAVENFLAQINEGTWYFRVVDLATKKAYTVDSETWDIEAERKVDN